MDYTLHLQDAAGRLAVLKAHSKNLRAGGFLHPHVNLENLASDEHTNNFTGKVIDEEFQQQVLVCRYYCSFFVVNQF